MTTAWQGFALVPYGHARFCEGCALRVAEPDAGCPVCRAQIRCRPKDPKFYVQPMSQDAVGPHRAVEHCTWIN